MSIWRTRPPTNRTNQVAATLAVFGLEDFLHHFRQRKNFLHKQTWRKVMKGKLHRSRCDYIMGTDRRLFQTVSIRDPRHFSTDHLMIVAKYLVKPTACHKRYLRGQLTFPLKWPIGPMSQADHIFDEVKQYMPHPPRNNKKPRPTWLSDKTLKLIDERSDLKCRQHCDTDTTRKYRQLTRAINSSLNADQKRRTEVAGAAIEEALSGDTPNLRQAYQILQSWHKHHGDRPCKPSRQDLETVTNECADLYREEDPIGAPIPIHVQPKPINDTVPSEEEIQNAVSHLRNNKASGPSKMKGEHVKEWLDRAYPEPQPGDEDLPVPHPEAWLKLVELIQHQFKTGKIAHEVKWSLLALLPKPDGSMRGVGLIEVIWKLTEAIIDTRVKECIKFHDMLHGFTTTRGTNTAILEAKLQQEYANISQIPLFQVYLDLRKAYDKLHRKRALATLEAYGMGPNLL